MLWALGASPTSFPIDVRAHRKRELDRLRELGVFFEELPLSASEALFDRFLADFADVERGRSLKDRIFRARPVHPALDLEPVLRSDAVCSRAEKSSVSWLTRLGRDRL